MITCTTCGNKWPFEKYDREVAGEDPFEQSYECPSCGGAGDEARWSEKIQ